MGPSSRQAVAKAVQATARATALAHRVRLVARASRARRALERQQRRNGPGRKTPRRAASTFTAGESARETRCLDSRPAAPRAAAPPFSRGIEADPKGSSRRFRLRRQRPRRFGDGPATASPSRPSRSRECGRAGATTRPPGPPRPCRWGFRATDRRIPPPPLVPPRRGRPAATLRGDLRPAPASRARGRRPLGRRPRALRASRRGTTPRREAGPVRPARSESCLSI